MLTKTLIGQILFTCFLLGGFHQEISPATGSLVTSKQSCKEHPKVIGKCFRLRGRLSVYNGNPSLRIWRLGTKRILGVSDQRFADPEVDNIPESLRSMIASDTDFYGEFLVCPFTPSRPGEMQLVCIQEAKNIVARKQTGAE